MNTKMSLLFYSSFLSFLCSPFPLLRIHPPSPNDLDYLNWYFLFLKGIEALVDKAEDSNHLLNCTSVLWSVSELPGNPGNEHRTSGVKLQTHLNQSSLSQENLFIGIKTIQCTGKYLRHLLYLLQVFQAGDTPSRHNTPSPYVSKETLLQ